MKSPFYFIVKPYKGTRYANTEDWDGTEIIVNTSEEDAKFSNRKAIVVQTPLGYDGPIKSGYTLLVHHNVFKYYNDMYGRRKSGKSFFKEDTFFIDPDQFFMYHDGTQWNAHDRYCFVSPISSEECYIQKPTHEPLMGRMEYPNNYLESKGVKKGTLVTFAPDSEYEFDVEGEMMYRIFDHQITMKV